MNSKNLTYLLLTASLITVIAWMSNAFNDRVEPGIIEPKPVSTDNAIAVNVVDIKLQEPVAGSIVAKQATDISSRILARIEQIKVRAGDTVKQGDILIDLEKTDLKSREAQAIEQARSIKVRLDEAILQSNRYQDLLKQGMVARADFDQVEATKNTLKADLSQAQQQLKEMQSSLQYSTIRAPIDGKIIDRYAEPGDTASPGKKLLSLYNPLSLRVEANVREQLALSLKIGDPVVVEIPSLERKFTGSIEELVPAANTGARSFQINVIMNYSVNLRPGMYARLLFDLKPEPRILIPANYITSVGQLDIVLVVSENQAQRRIITAGKKHGDLVEVLSGLQEHDLIVLPQH